MTQDTDVLPKTADGHGSYMYCVIATDQPQAFAARGSVAAAMPSTPSIWTAWPRWSATPRRRPTRAPAGT